MELLEKELPIEAADCRAKQRRMLWCCTLMLGRCDELKGGRLFR